MRVVNRKELRELQQQHGELVFSEVSLETLNGVTEEVPADEWLVLLPSTEEEFRYNVLSPYAISLRGQGSVNTAIAALITQGECIALDFNHVTQDAQKQYDEDRYVVMEDDEIRAMIDRLQAVLASRPVVSDEPEIRKPAGSLHPEEPSAEWMRWYRAKSSCTLRESRLEGIWQMRLRGY